MQTNIYSLGVRLMGITSLFEVSVYPVFWFSIYLN